MKHNKKLFFSGIILIIFGTIFSINIISAHEIILIFLGVGLLLISINISSILLYKSFNSEKEYCKYIFSFINTVIGIIIGGIIGEKIMQMAFLIK